MKTKKKVMLSIVLWLPTILLLAKVLLSWPIHDLPYGSFIIKLFDSFLFDPLFLVAIGTIIAASIGVYVLVRNKATFKEALGVLTMAFPFQISPILYYFVAGLIRHADAYLTYGGGSGAFWSDEMQIYSIALAFVVGLVLIVDLLFFGAFLLFTKVKAKAERVSKIV